MRYIALLRGINVGGNTMIKMSELKAVFEQLGLENVATYINSGNIAFDSKAVPEASLVISIQEAISKAFGRDISTMVREREDIERILASNPFTGQYESHKEMHVLFLKEEMPADKQQQLLAAVYPPERLEVKGREIYCHLPMGVADSLLGKGFIEKKLKVAVTARNWRTVGRLVTL